MALTNAQRDSVMRRALVKAIVFWPRSTRVEKPLSDRRAPRLSTTD